MQLFLFALDQTGFEKVKPIVDGLIKADESSHDSIFNNQEEDEETSLKHIIAERQWEEKLFDASCQFAVKKEIMDEDKDEVTAHEDIIETIGRIKPEKEKLFYELGGYLIPAEKLAQLYPEYKKIFASINLDEMMEKHGYFRETIPLETYEEVFKKNNNFMNYCVENNLSFLSLIVGEV
jgi:hypothetical protein